MATGPHPPGPHNIFVCSTEMPSLSVSAMNATMNTLNANIPSQVPNPVTTNDVAGNNNQNSSCGGQPSPPPVQRFLQPLFPTSPPATVPQMQPSAHVAADILVDPSGNLQSEVIIHSTPDPAHSHLHHHVHQHHYHHPSHQRRSIHFSPPGFHISISPASMVKCLP